MELPAAHRNDGQRTLFLRNFHTLNSRVLYRERYKSTIMNLSLQAINADDFAVLANKLKAELGQEKGNHIHGSIIPHENDILLGRGTISKRFEHVLSALTDLEKACVFVAHLSHLAFFDQV
jgi:hypothetical protein